MSWLRFSVFALPLLLNLPAWAQDSTCLHHTLPFRILYRGDAPSPRLAPADLRAEFRGKPVRIAALSPGIQPHRVLILLDASGSQQDVWRVAAYAAEQAVATNLSDASFALHIFGEKAGERIEFSDGNAKVLNRLYQIRQDKTYVTRRVYGSTALFDALRESVKMFGTPRTGDTLLLISDGEDNSSRSKEGMLSNALIANGVRLFFCIIMSPDGGPTPEMREGPEFIQSLALATGGLSVEPFRDARLGDFFSGHPSSSAVAAFSLLDKQIGSYDTIEIMLPASVTKPEEWKLSLTKEKRRELKGAQILYPHKLLSCSEYVSDELD